MSFRACKVATAYLGRVLFLGGPVGLRHRPSWWTRRRCCVRAPRGAFLTSRRAGCPARPGRARRQRLRRGLCTAWWVDAARQWQGAAHVFAFRTVIYKALGLRRPVSPGSRGPTVRRCSSTDSSPRRPRAATGRGATGAGITRAAHPHTAPGTDHVHAAGVAGRHTQASGAFYVCAPECSTARTLSRETPQGSPARAPAGGQRSRHVETATRSRSE